MNDFLQNLRGGQKDNRAAKTRRGFDNNTQQPHYNSSSHFHSNGSYQNPRVGNGKRPMRPNPQNQMQADPNSQVLSSEVIENILVLAETMVKNQEFLAAAHERRAAAEERKADSLEEIAEYLRVIAVPSLGEDSFQDEYQADVPVEEVFIEPDPRPIRQAEARTFQEPLEPAPVKKRRGRKPKALKLAEEQEAAEKKAAADKAKKAKVKVLKRTKAEKMQIADAQEGNTELLSREAVMEIVNSMRKDGATFDQVAQRLVALGQPTFSGRGEWHAQTVHRLCNTKK